MSRQTVMAMVDRGLFDAYDAALSSNADMVQRAMGVLAEQSGSLTHDELTRVYAQLVDRFGQYAAAIAVEFYMRQRGLSDAEEGYQARQFRPDNGGLLADDVRRTDPSQLANAAVQRVMGYSDETLIRNAQADPAHPRWAFVPHAGACGWCIMLGSQGFVYSSARTAKLSRHAHCRCSTAVDFDANNLSLEGYDPSAMLDAYQDCRAAVESQAKRDWAAMSPEQRKAYADATPKRRGAYDRFLRNKIAGEMARRDREWLRTGKVPEVGYETESLRSEIERKRPWEKRTAERLSSHGVLSLFQIDEREYIDDKTGLKQKVGLPDLFGGIEIKTLGSAASRNTINGYLKNASRKEGARTVVFDNSENENLNDSNLIELLDKCPSFKRGSVYVLTHDGGYVRIR